MDTYVHPRIWGYTRKDFIETKDIFIHRSKVLAERGRHGLIEEMVEDYRKLDNEEVTVAR
jgi:hypothetical protein